MNNKDLKRKVKQKLNEINQKIDDLKTKDIKDTTMLDQIETLILRLEAIRNEISRKYLNAEAEGAEQWDEMEKNIYKDFNAFDDAFRKTGLLFGSGKGKPSDDPGHFYRPGDETI